MRKSKFVCFNVNQSDKNRNDEEHGGPNMQLSVNATGFEALEKSLDELEEALREVGRKKSEVYHCLYELGLDVSPLPREAAENAKENHSVNDTVI